MRNRKNDIERYLRGELTPSEMHALEKEALNDPFLSEALEGIEHAGADNFLYDLHRLNKSVHDRMRRKTRKNSKTIRMWGWTSAVAATLLLLAVSGFLAVKILKDQQRHQQSMKTTPGGAQDASVQDSSAVASVDSTALALNQKEKASAAEIPRADSSPVKNGLKEPTALNESKTDGAALSDATTRAGQEGTLTGHSEDDVKKESASQINPLAIAEIPEPDSLVRHIPESQQSAARAMEGQIAGVERHHRAAPKTDAAFSGKVVEGKVTSEDGHVLPGVNVIIRGTSVATVTDEDGYYRLTIPEGSSLVFGFIGFESQEIPANTNELNVRLEEDISALSEVVITTGSGSGENGDDASAFQVAEPDGGKVDFKTYLANAVKYPQEAITNKTEGKVTVRFTVEPNGKLTDFEVVKGIGSGCEEELIRAIREGPYWKPSKRGEQPVKDKIRVKFRFDLPR